MPEMPTAVPAPALPQIALQPKHRVWRALREQLLGSEPDSESVTRLRALLGHLYDSPSDQLRALQGMFSATPAAFRTLGAAECGWQPEMELYGVSWDLAVIAAVFHDADEEGR